MNVFLWHSYGFQRIVSLKEKSLAVNFMQLFSIYVYCITTLGVKKRSLAIIIQGERKYSAFEHEVRKFEVSFLF